MDFLYLTFPQKSIVVGRDKNCDIVIDNPYVSRIHLTIQPRRDNLLAVVSVAGINGISTDGENIPKDSRKIIGKSDFIIIGEITILWCGSYLVLSLPAGSNHVSKLKRMSISDSSSDDEAFRRSTKLQNFTPAVRIRAYCDDSPIEIEAPPARKPPQKPSLVLAAGPALTMALPILLGAGRKLSILTSVFASIWAVLNVSGHKRKEKQEERRRRLTYTTYIRNKDKEILDRYEKQRKYLHEEFPNVSHYFKNGCNPAILWNRNIDEDKRMDVRLGIGNTNFPIDIVIPKEKFAQLDDSLKELPIKIKEKYNFLENVPITIALNRGMIIGIVMRDEDKDFDVLRGMLLQICVLATPRSLGIIFPDAEMWEKVFLNEFVFSPFYINEYNERRLDNIDFLIAITRNNEVAIDYSKERGAISILLLNNINDSPARVDNLLLLENDFSGMIRPSEGLNSRISISFDRISQKESFEYIRLMNKLLGGIIDENKEIPSLVQFGQILDSQEVTFETIGTSWNESDINKTISFPVGIGENGEIIRLDLHEKKMGPHGLVAGTTGSGKSELLTTIILSAALNYPPDKLGFFLIDYKGGSMSNQFKDLPHLMGFISNLSREESRRAMISLYSENNRRQEVFASVGVSNITEYVAGYDAGKYQEALPHILIIIDEFAELKKEEPEFMQQLISIAAVGRSLGVHLIMATQKPAGVIDDKIRSNSRFRICLRVEDKTDSMDMLKKSDAVDITNCGRGYLQVGNDEIYTQFQCGYAFSFKEEMVKQQAEIFDETGTRININREHLETTNGENWYEYLMEEIRKSYIEYDNRDVYINPLWIEALCEEIPCGERDEIENKRIIAFADSPAKHMHIPVMADIIRWGHTCILGGASSGKSNFLSGIILSNLHSNDFYVIDYGGGRLRAYKDSNRCGGYIDSDNVSRVKMMLSFFDEEIDARQRREKLRGEVDIAGQDSTDQTTTSHKEVLRILVIDNVGEVIKDCEIAPGILLKILKYGRKLGIILVCSAHLVASDEIPSKLFDKMDRVILFGEFESYLASSLLKTRATLIPSTEDIPGRGVMNVDGEYLKIQAVKYDSNIITNVIKYDNTRNNQKSHMYPYVPDDLSLDYFLKRASNEYPVEAYGKTQRAGPNYEDILPIGYEEETGKLFILPLNRLGSVLLAGRKSSGKKSLCNHIEIVASLYGYSSVRICNPYVLINQFEKTDLIIIEDLGKVLSDFYCNPFTTEDEEKLANILGNNRVCGRKKTAVIICALVENVKSDFRGKPVLSSILEKPYAIYLGGGLDESRLFDFSYIPYSIQIRKKNPGYGTVLKSEGMEFFGDVIIPKHQP